MCLLVLRGDVHYCLSVAASLLGVRTDWWAGTGSFPVGGTGGGLRCIGCFGSLPASDSSFHLPDMDRGVATTNSNAKAAVLDAAVHELLSASGPPLYSDRLGVLTIISHPHTAGCWRGRPQNSTGASACGGFA